jgi:uncharacterized membrane protein SpoIIM required for sporulation
VNVEAFVAARRAEWDELAALADQAHGRPERLGTDGVLRLGYLYRGAAADLALARRRYRHEAVVPYLEQLVGRSRNLVYDTSRERETLRSLATTGYWRRVAAQRTALLLAGVLLALPAVLGLVWALQDPTSAEALAPQDLHAVTQPQGPADLGLSSGEQAQFASAIFTNNIQVTFLAFAGGALGGLGTAFVLLQNGALLGIVTGLAIGAGNGDRMAQLVLAHGVLEMSCIVVAGAAGLRLGAAIIRPGRRPRSVAVPEVARDVVLIVLGTAPWLVLAGLVEGFVTPRGIGAGPAAVVGILLAGSYWGLLAWRGRPPTSPPPTPGITPVPAPSA